LQSKYKIDYNCTSGGFSKSFTDIGIGKNSQLSKSIGTEDCFDSLCKVKQIKINYLLGFSNKCRAIIVPVVYKLRKQ